MNHSWRLKIIQREFGEVKHEPKIEQVFGVDKYRQSIQQKD